jgi:putative Ca2+/H+ antiporter (TMEM165/GDT1 family)
VNFGLAAITFALVIPAELPDKTFISGVVLSSRYSAFPVWIGAASGLIVQAGIAVLAGRLLALLPHRIVESIVAALFFAGAAYLLAIKEKMAIGEGEAIATKEERAMSDPEVKSVAKRLLSSQARVVLTTFVIITVAEFGDLTQVLIANLSARYKDPLSVFIGASVGFIVISGLGAALGQTITRVVPLGLVRKISGLALLALGILSTVNAAT